MLISDGVAFSAVLFWIDKKKNFELTFHSSLEFIWWVGKDDSTECKILEVKKYTKRKHKMF